MKEKSSYQNILGILKNYKFGYINVIFLLIITTLVFYTMLENEKGNGKTLNIAGKQRVYTQRSVYLLNMISQVSSDKDRSKLISTLVKEFEEFKINHKKIINHKDKKDITMMETSLHIGKENLNTIQIYITKMEYIISKIRFNDQNIAQESLSEFNAFVFNELYMVLDQVVFLLQRKDETRYLVMIKTLFFLMFGRIALIFIEARFVYRPLNKSLKRKKSRLNIVKEKLNKESKSLKQARHYAIKGGNHDVINEVNISLRKLNLKFLEKLKNDSIFNHLLAETRKDFNEVYSLTMNYSDLVALKRPISLKPLNLKNMLKDQFLEKDLNLKFSHEFHIHAHSFLISLLLKEYSDLLKSPLYNNAEIKIEHINNKIHMSLFSKKSSGMDLPDNKKNLIEFLVQKNKGRFRIDNNNLYVSFEGFVDVI